MGSDCLSEPRTRLKAYRLLFFSISNPLVPGIFSFSNDLEVITIILRILEPLDIFSRHLLFFLDFSFYHSTFMCFLSAWRLVFWNSIHLEDRKRKSSWSYL